MNATEVVSKLRKGYGEHIKLLIERGHYEAAGGEMRNMSLVLTAKKGEIIRDVHCGLSFIVTAELLKEALLERNEESIRHFKEKFEAYAAQTTLPLRD